MTSVVQTLTPAHAIIEVTHSGEITASDLRKSGKEALTIARDQNMWRLLTDCSAATKVPGAIDIINLIGLVEQAELDAGFRQALIWPDDAEARLGFDFWRTVEANQGLHAKAFGSRDAAIAWLES
jgi:hypothetical protein